MNQRDKALALGRHPAVNEDLGFQIFSDHREAYIESLKKQGCGRPHELRVRRILEHYIIFLKSETRLSSQEIYSKRTIQTYTGWKNQRHKEKAYPPAYRYEIKRYLKRFIFRYVRPTKVKRLSQSGLKKRLELFINETDWPSQEKAIESQNRIRRFIEFLDRIQFSNYEKLRCRTLDDFVREEEKTHIVAYGKPYSAYSIRVMVTEIRKYLKYLVQNQLIEHQDYLTPPRLNHFLSAAIKKYVEFCLESRGLAPRTVLGIQTDLDQLADHLLKLEIRTLPAIQILHIESYVATRKLSLSGISNLYSNLRRFLKYLFLEKMIPRNIGGLIVGPRIFSLAHIPKCLSQDELKLLFQENPERRLSTTEIRARAIIYLLLYTGLRSAEAADVMLDDLDWEKKQILLRNRKNKRDHLQVLPDPAIHAIYEYVTQVRPNDRPERNLFFSVLSPIVPVESTGISRAVRSYFKPRGIQGQAHRLRHTHAQLLLDSGSSLKQVQESLGHERGESTQIYTKTSMERMRKYVVAERD